MTTRTRYAGASIDVPWDDAGPQEGFGNQYDRLLGVLLDHSALPLTAIGGTANAVTATLDPVLDGGGLIDGMKFTLTWAAANTGGVTLAINGGSAVPVLDAEGGALTADQVSSGLRSLIEYIGGNFRILSAAAAGGASAGPTYQVFTASGTWTKPSGLPPDAMVIVEAWGGGGGGCRASTSGGGGGGGGYSTRRFRATDLPSSVAISIGAGGAGRTGSAGDGSSGGNTTFGSLLTAYGGAGGSNTSPGGGGGSDISAGSGGTGGLIGGGAGATATPSAAGHGVGGGGGGGGVSTGGAAGSAVYGGGGGGGGAATASPIAGGVSLHGGNGGAGGDASPVPTAGTAPAGGGGGGGGNANGADGARGEVRVWIP